MAAPLWNICFSEIYYRIKPSLEIKRDIPQTETDRFVLEPKFHHIASRADKLARPARSIKRGKFNLGKCFKSIRVVAAAAAANEWCNFGPIARRLTATPPTHTHTSPEQSIKLEPKTCRALVSTDGNETNETIRKPGTRNSGVESARDGFWNVLIVTINSARTECVTIQGE